MKIFYTYIHYKKGTNIPFYVGKGTGNRAYGLKDRNIFWRRIYNKYGYDVEIVCDNLSEQDALNLEISLIFAIGRRDLGTGTLVNLTDGGEGISGFSHSEETKRKIGRANKGNTHSKGNTQTEENKRKMSERMKGNKYSLGLKRSDETKRKLSIKATGRVLSTDTKEKMSKNHHSSILVLNIKTGIYYDNVKMASESIEGMSLRKLYYQLQEAKVNETDFIKV